MTKITSTFVLMCLLSACRPADGVIFFAASKNGDTDTVTIEARDLLGVDLEAFLGQSGVPIASDGDCDVFNGNLLDFSQIDRPGVVIDAGLIAMTGASGEPAVNFTFDANVNAYTPDPNNTNLFLAGDDISIEGNGGGPIKDFGKGIEFPQETILVEIGDVVRGSDVLVTWNESDVKADEVSVAFAASDLFFQDQRTIVCSFRDTGSGTIPGALTILLAEGGLVNTLVVARVNGVNFLLDPDLAIEQMERGKEFILAAFSIDTQVGVGVGD